MRANQPGSVDGLPGKALRLADLPTNILDASRYCEHLLQECFRELLKRLEFAPHAVEMLAPLPLLHLQRVEHQHQRWRASSTARPGSPGPMVVRPLGLASGPLTSLRREHHEWDRSFFRPPLLFPVQCAWAAGSSKRAFSLIWVERPDGTD
jgi:hypothetical protein